MTAVGETFLPRMEYDLRLGSAARGLPTVMLDLTEESARTGEAACWLPDRALEHRGGSWTSGSAVTG
jgi:hypothetical protein